MREFDHECVKIAHPVIAIVGVSAKNRLGIIDAKGYSST
jgi:hypothetical protein